MAHAAIEHLGLEKVLWIPTGSPKYRQAAVARAEDRLQMLRLALAGEPRFAIDARELAPQASGYTVDTLRTLRSEFADASLYLLMGADQYAKLESWHRPREVASLARIAVFSRPGFHLEKPGALVIPMQSHAISASDIRARAARGEDLSALVPAPVANYISRKGLYR